MDQLIVAAQNEMKSALRKQLPKERQQRFQFIQKSQFRDIEQEEGFQQYLNEKQMELLNLEEKM